MPLMADNDCELNSFIAMDRWLTAVEQDHSSTSLPQKVIADKPADLTDECFDGAGQKLSNDPLPGRRRERRGHPAHGGRRRDHDRREQVPAQAAAPHRLPRRSRSPTPSGRSSRRRSRPGVCDFSKPGVDQQPTIPWLTYQNARGQVIYGGRPLGKPPASREFHASARRG